MMEKAFVEPSQHAFKILRCAKSLSHCGVWASGDHGPDSRGVYLRGLCSALPWRLSHRRSILPAKTPHFRKP